MLRPPHRHPAKYCGHVVNTTSKRCAKTACRLLNSRKMNQPKSDVHSYVSADSISRVGLSSRLEQTPCCRSGLILVARVFSLNIKYFIDKWILHGYLKGIQQAISTEVTDDTKRENSTLPSIYIGRNSFHDRFDGYLSEHFPLAALESPGRQNFSRNNRTLVTPDITYDQQVVLFVMVLGAAGSFLHGATSFIGYAGKSAFDDAVDLVVLIATTYRSSAGPRILPCPPRRTDFP